MPYKVISYCKFCFKILFCNIYEEEKPVSFNYCDKCPFEKCKRPDKIGYGTHYLHKCNCDKYIIGNERLN